MTREELQKTIWQLQEWLDKGAQADVEITTTMPLQASLQLMYPEGGLRWGFVHTPVEREWNLHITVKGKEIDVNPRFL
jgi:hypothetical protein